MIQLNEKQKIIIEHIKHILNYVFQSLLLLFLITLLLQQFYPDYVNSRININWFMLVVIVIGALSILFPPKKDFFGDIATEKPVSWKDLALVLILGILGGIIIFLKLKKIGWIGYVISILGGLIIILLSWLVLTEKEEEG